MLEVKNWKLKTTVILQVVFRAYWLCSSSGSEILILTDATGTTVVWDDLAMYARMVNQSTKPSRPSRHIRNMH